MADEQPAGQTQDPTDATSVETNTGNEPELKAPAEGDGNEPGGQGADKRIASLSRMKNKYKAEADHWKNIAAKFATIDSQTVASSNTNQITQPTTTQPSGYQSEEVERAFNVLRQRGVATLGELEEVRRQSDLRSRWDKAHFENAQVYNAPGSKYPHYDPEEVEQYGREHGLAEPRAAYREMYFDEIVDVIKSETRGRPSKSLTSERPTRITDSGKEPLTLENFRAKLAGPEGQAFYGELAKNPAKFDSLLADIVK